MAILESMIGCGEGFCKVDKICMFSEEKFNHYFHILFVAKFVWNMQCKGRFKSNQIKFEFELTWMMNNNIEKKKKSNTREREESLEKKSFSVCG